ncbi:MAG: threonine/serine dehydratase [Acidobacteriota bacterium]
MSTNSVETLLTSKVGEEDFTDSALGVVTDEIVNGVDEYITTPISFSDVMAAIQRIRPYLSMTALRNYPSLDQEVANEIKVFVKHENHNPTNSFKARNGLAVMTALSQEERRRGVVTPTRGNHGQGVAWAGALLGVPVTICVPVGNNPEKNEAMRGFGATVIESGRDYDEAIEVAKELAHTRDLYLIHTANDPRVLAGAGTIVWEMLYQLPEQLDAIVVAIGGGSMAVGALTVIQALRPNVAVYGVQAAGACAMYESWRSGHPVTKTCADTFADGLATRGIYQMTYGPLRAGLTDFITVSEAEIAYALRLLLRTTHNLVEGAGAAGLAGLLALREQLAGKRVAIILSGANIDTTTLHRVINNQI